jgi:23S rRNA (uracil1939-C5)-methyltransferase
MELRTSGMAHGGAAVARVEGKAFFVDGALPGELVLGEVTRDKGSWGKAKLISVLERSPDRVEPLCPHFKRCGGCQWQFGTEGAQREWKHSIVTGQLSHLGQIDDPPVREVVAVGPSFGYRNRMDYRVFRGRPALHERGSRRLVPLTECPLLHPNLADVFADLGDLSGAESLTLRTATTTGAVLAIIEGSVPRQARSWGCNVTVKEGEDLRTVYGEMEIEETIAGIPFRITGTAFFQTNTRGAESLVTLVEEAANVTGDDTVLDAYAGGGLFAATVGRRAARVVAIEQDQTAAADLHANLARAGITEFRIMASPVEDAIDRIGEYWDVAIVDPPRQGLGVNGVDAVTAARPHTVVYVSCDPASLARDSSLLAEVGYTLEWVAPIDMFPQTYHIECVARFAR